MQKASVIKKANEVNHLVEKINQAKSIVLFDYQGLTVAEFTELRGNLRNAGCDVKIYKNNISRRASIMAGYESLAESFVGAKAIIISYSDIVAPAKIISEFAKNKKVVKVDSGVIEGKVVSREEVMEIANLPSRETLLTQLAAGLLMPVRELAIGLNMISEQKE